MTIPLELIESDAWPVLRQKIIERRSEHMEALLKVSTIDQMTRIQGFVHGLDWVLEEATPKPLPRDDNDD